jgi:hypothetical protein
MSGAHFPALPRGKCIEVSYPLEFLQGSSETAKQPLHPL